MGTIPSEDRLIYDWARADGEPECPPPRVMLNDETLRDGLQSASATDPPDACKVEILRLMDRLGIETANVGLPGAGRRQRDSATRLCRAIRDEAMKIHANCAARTVLADIEPIVDVAQATGVPIEACLFIGSSPIRRYAEDWELDSMLQRSREAIEFAVREGLEVMYVTEDTVRAAPDDLRVLFTAAIDAGARRLCLCDTVGAAVPRGVTNLVAWVRGLLAELGVADRIGIDWHGHRDRGLDLVCSLAALQGGADRVHATALGIGERVGNTTMELLLVNLELLGWRDHDLTSLPLYVDAVSQALGVPIPANAPVVGRDAFRTATGVHAAAVMKAERKGQAWLADRVYSSVPARWIGREQQIEVGPMSGRSNVQHCLERHGVPPEPELVAAVLARAKRSNRVLTEDEILSEVEPFLNPVPDGTANPV